MFAGILMGKKTKCTSNCKTFVRFVSTVHTNCSPVSVLAGKNAHYIKCETYNHEMVGWMINQYNK
jgi:hypothetical protein